MKNKVVFEPHTKREETIILQQLGKLFAPHKLYMVGGCVRDICMHKKKVGDIDLASTLSIEELKRRIDETEFKIVGIIEKTGTAIIRFKDYKYEYTRFRKDLYRQESGQHKPEKVEFVKDIKIDAERRDFKVNAIYIEVISGEVADPLDGITEIEKKILSTTRSPENVFEEDGLRLMRLARFSGQLDFEVEKRTMQSAKENVWRIKDIATERIFDELSKMLKLTSKGIVKSFKTLFEIGLNKYVLDGSAKQEEAELLKFPNLDEVSKWAILFKNIKDKHEERIFSYFRNMGASKKLSEQVCKLCFICDKQPTGKANLMKFIIENKEIIPSLILFHRATNNTEKADKIEKTCLEMKEENIPMEIKELPINGQDLIDMQIPNTMRGKVLNELMMAILSDFRLRDRDLALKYIESEYKREKN